MIQDDTIVQKLKEIREDFEEIVSAWRGRPWWERDKVIEEIEFSARTLDMLIVDLKIEKVLVSLRRS